MRLLAHAILIPGVLILASCESLTKVDNILERPNLAEIQPDYFDPCERPTELQDGLTVGQLIQILSDDAGKLNECADRHQNLGDAVRIRDGIQSAEASNE